MSWAVKEMQQQTEVLTVAAKATSRNMFTLSPKGIEGLGFRKKKPPLKEEVI